MPPAMIYILLPVHNRREITAEFIKSLLAQTYSHYHLVLLDDGSTDGTAEMVQNSVDAEQLTVLRGTGDWWWAGACQKGYDWLRDNQVSADSIVLLINDDVNFSGDFLASAVSILQDNPDTLLLPHGYSSITGEHLTGGAHANFAFMTFRECSNPEKINVLHTRGLFMRWRDMERIGEWKPKLLPHYMSDYEYTIRAYRKGLKLLVPPDFKIWFNEVATGPKGFQGESLRSAWKKLFSEKQPLNPIRRTHFVCLVCQPKFMIPLNIAKVWLSAFGHLFLQTLLPSWRTDKVQSKKDIYESE